MPSPPQILHHLLSHLVITMDTLQQILSTLLSPFTPLHLTCYLFSHRVHFLCWIPRRTFWWTSFLPFRGDWIFFNEWYQVMENRLMENTLKLPFLLLGCGMPWTPLFLLYLHIRIVMYLNTLLEDTEEKIGAYDLPYLHYRRAVKSRHWLQWCAARHTHMKRLSRIATPASREMPWSLHLPESNVAKRWAVCHKIDLEAADRGARWGRWG